MVELTNVIILSYVYKSTREIRPLNFTQTAAVLGVHFQGNRSGILPFCCNLKMVGPTQINVGLHVKIKQWITVAKLPQDQCS